MDFERNCKKKKDLKICKMLLLLQTTNKDVELPCSINIKIVGYFIPSNTEICGIYYRLIGNHALHEV